MTQQQKNEMQKRARAYALCASLDSNEQGKINRAYIEGAKWAKERFKFVLRDGLHYDAIPRDIDNYPLEFRENAKEYVLNTPHDYDSVEDTEDIAQLMECAYCQGMADRDNIGRWISVEDELPEDGVYVATLDNGGRKDIRHFYHDKWYGRFGNEYRGITHWLPLPAPIVIPKNDTLPEEGMPLPAPLSCSVFPNNHKKGGQQ